MSLGDPINVNVVVSGLSGAASSVSTGDNISVTVSPTSFSSNIASSAIIPNSPLVEGQLISASVGPSVANVTLSGDTSTIVNSQCISRCDVTGGMSVSSVGTGSGVYSGNYFDTHVFRSLATSGLFGDPTAAGWPHVTEGSYWTNAFPSSYPIVQITGENKGSDAQDIHFLSPTLDQLASLIGDSMVQLTCSDILTDCAEPLGLPDSYATEWPGGDHITDFADFSWGYPSLMDARCLSDGCDWFMPRKLVYTTGDQHITGIKNFVDSPVFPGATFEVDDDDDFVVIFDSPTWLAPHGSAKKGSHPAGSWRYRPAVTGDFSGAGRISVFPNPKYAPGGSHHYPRYYRGQLENPQQWNQLVISGSGISAREDGTLVLDDISVLNFTGEGVGTEITYEGQHAVLNVGITGAPISAQDEGLKFSENASSFNFVGPGVNASKTVVDDKDVINVAVPGATIFTAEAGTGAGFFAYRTTEASISTDTYTDLSSDAKEFDIRGDYNVSTYKFIPTVSGKYLIQAQARFDGGFNAGEYAELVISGTQWPATGRIAESTVADTQSHPEDLSLDVSRIIESPATGEYYRAFVYNNDNSSRTLRSGSHNTYFTAHIFAHPTPISGVTNIGLGTGLSSGISGGVLQFHSIKGLGNVFITGSVPGMPGHPDTQTIYISGSGGGTITGASNIGTGSGIYSGTANKDLKFRSLLGTGNIYITGGINGDEHIYISGSGGGGEGTLTDASNIGYGSGAFSGTINNELKFRSFSGVSGITITGSGDDTIVISGQTGNFLDRSETGDFYTLERGTLIGAENVGYGSGTFSGVEDNILKFRSLSGVSGVEITGSGDGTIVISGQTGNFLDRSETGQFYTLERGTITGASNIGYGSGAFSGTVENDFKFRSFSGISGVTVTGSGDDTIVISGQTGNFLDRSETGQFYTLERGTITGASNIGYGSGAFSGTVENDFKFRSFSGISGVTVTGSGDDTIVISGETGNFLDRNETGQFYTLERGTITGASNIGMGSGFFSGTIDNDFKFRRISGISGVVITGYGNDTVVVSGQTGNFVDKTETGVYAVGAKDESALISDDVSIFDFVGPGVVATESDGTVTVNVAGATTFTSEAGTGAGFFAYSSSPQAVNSDVYTQVQFATKEFDIQNNFNTSTHRFTPSVSGKYIIQSQLQFDTLNTNESVHVIISGNTKGKIAESWVGGKQSFGHDDTVDVSTMIDTEGQGEYYQVYAYPSGTVGSKTLVVGRTGTYFDAHIFAQATPISGVTNIGMGTGLSSGLEGGILKFKSIKGAGAVFITGYDTNDAGDHSQTIYISGSGEGTITGASNIGTGSGLYSGTIDKDLKFKTIVGEGGIGISGDFEHLYITGGGGDVTWVDPPPTKNSPGKMGQIAFDNYYYYVCITGHDTDGLTGEWRRTAISEW